MKRTATTMLLCLLLAGCVSSAPETLPETRPETLPPETTAAASQPETAPLPETGETTQPSIAVELTDDEQRLLLQIGMAEANAGLGHGECPQCIALVMRTVLNRVASDRFSQTVQGVIYSPNQFTPVADGSFYNAEPNELCLEALDMVIYGWDESQGALYYEWCDGESWHSRNLNLLFQHCNTRFYN